MLRFVQEYMQDEKAIGAIAEENSLPLLLAAALYNRGLKSREEVQAFLYPGEGQLHDPYLMEDMGIAVNVVREAMNQNKRICVYGDYDADGVCATSMLAGYLNSVGADVRTYLPSRHEEGYGMHVEAVRALQQDGVELIITVDNGVSAIEEIALCYALGMRVIVTDHHQCPEALPQCEAILNPHRQGDQYPNKNLCGAGVVLKFIHGLAGYTEASRYLPICALATVADIVDLRGENRAIVALGLKDVHSSKGIEALLTVSGSASIPITSDTLAYRVAPRINAAGRMGDAGRALRLLQTEDGAEARELALLLNEENARRQQMEQSILVSAREMLKGVDTLRQRAILLCSTGWSAGVIGIVASRLREEYYRPVLLFHEEDGVLTGSCRSIPGVNLFECLQPFSDYFIRFGGHGQAAGITMEKKKYLDFREAFLSHLEQFIPNGEFLPTAFYESLLPVSKLSASQVEILERLAPHGQGNPRPVYYSQSVAVQDICTMGKENAHLRAKVAQGNARVDMVAFQAGHMVNTLSTKPCCDLLYTPEINEWQGVQRVQLQMRAIRPASVLRGVDGSMGERLQKQCAYKFFDAFYDNFLYNETQDVEKRVVPHMDQAVVEHMRGALCGVLAICVTPDGAKRLGALMEAHGLAHSVQEYFTELPKDIQPYNTVLLAPEFRKLTVTGYDTVIVYDGYGIAGMEDIWANGIGNCRVLLPAEPVGHTAEDMWAPYRLTREELGRIYMAMKAKVEKGAVPRDALLPQKQSGDYAAWLLALLVFIELGFFYRDGDMIGGVVDCPQRPLTQSKLYAAGGRSLYDHKGGKNDGSKAVYPEHS